MESHPGNKQNLISQLQNNQQQSMLYRLHQQHQNDEQLQQPEHYMKTQQMAPSKSKGLNQPISPNKPGYKMTMNNTVRTTNQKQTSQQTYNQNRIMKQSVQLDFIQPQNLASPVNQSSSFQAPPLSHMVMNKQKETFQRLGSQERLQKGSKIGYTSYKTNSKSNTTGNKRQYNVTMNIPNKNQTGMSIVRAHETSSGGGQSFVQSYLQTSNSNVNLNYLTEGAHAAQIASTNMQPNLIVGPHLINTNKTPNQISIQHPHFIKVKSKTNANPTRKNSPRFSGKYSVSQARNPMRDSKEMPKNGKKLNQQSISSQQQQSISQQQNQAARAQIFSQPSSPSKELPMDQGAQRVVTYSNSLVDGYQSQMKKQIMNQNMAINTNLESKDFRTNTNKFSPQQQMSGSGISISDLNQITASGTSQSIYQKKKQKFAYQNPQMRQSVKQTENEELKGDSSHNLYQSVQGPAKVKNINNNNQSKNQQRIQSGNIKQNQQSFQNTIRRLNSPPITNLQSNQQQSQLDSFQKKQLNMVVSKKIGNIASGKCRRENRNQMMKNNQNQVLDSKSVVGSMGSMGSLAPFMGVETNQFDQPENIIHNNQTAGELSTSQPMHYSQLQQMHLNNLNPMFFATGEALPSSTQMGSIGSNNSNQNQHKTMGGTMNPQKDSNGGQPPLNTQQSNGTILYRPNKSSQQSYQQYEQGDSQRKQQPVQVKTSMIQMRKINPISKTVANGSQNTSVDRKKSNSQGVSMHQQQISQHQQHVNQVNQNLKMSGINYKMMNTKVQKHSMMSGKPTAQTAKVSYNNSPSNRSRLTSEKNGQNLNKRQMQLGKQQPIGQPMGDIPLISQYYSLKQGQTSKGEIDNQIESGQQQPKKKHHQFAQSVLIADANQQKPVTKYKTIYQLEQNQIADDSAEFKEHPSMEQDVEGLTAMQQLAAGGKLKIKMMSETNSPPNYQFSSNQMGNLNSQSQKHSTQNSVTNSQINNQQAQKENLRRNSDGTKAFVGPHKNVKSSSQANNRQPNKTSQKNLKDESGQQYLNQYFKQQKHNFGKYNKYAQIDSPKEGSIERVRHNDIVQQEQQISQMNRHLGNVVEFEDDDKRDEKAGSKQEELLEFLINMSASQQGECALVIGDMREGEVSEKLKKLLKMKMQYILSPGNIGQKSNQQWLESISLSKQRVMIAKGEHDNQFNYKDTLATKIGNIKIGIINGYQLKPNCDQQTLLDILQRLDSDVLIHGYTNEVGIYQVGNKYLINPGIAASSLVLLAIQNDFMMAFQCTIKNNELAIDRMDININKSKQQRRVANSFFNSCVIKSQKEEQKQNQNKTTEYIIQNIEQQDRSNLSPRSKEVWLIKQLNIDCFARYNKPPKTQLELYKIGKMLGKGAFGKVNLGLHRLTRKLVAIKSINMDFMKEESQKKKIMNEIDILKNLKHPNNIKLLETFQTDKHHMIVMELCPGGDLLNYVRKRRKLNEKYAKFVFRQIMEGIAYLHKQKVSHRDIKLDNILLDGHGNIKIGDFGVSRQIEVNEILFEQCGTPAYIAPEIVKDMGYKGFPVDIWSAGICLYAMLYGNVPFKANQIGDLNTVEQLNQEIEYKKDLVSKEAIDLLKKMLQKVPKQRVTADQVLQHEWLNEDLDSHIDIFDEQELELIRKEFTYVVQKKKLKEFREMKEQAAQEGDLLHLASRMPNDLNTEFTECSIQTHENSLLKNDSSRSVILCPFNTQTGDKTADKIIAQTLGLMMDKDIMIRFHHRVRELDRNYEKLNNQDFDNGVYHKYAYKQKAQAKKDEQAQAIKEEEIQQSDVQMNNLVSPSDVTDTARQRIRENADSTFHNYYVKINNKIINDTVKMGFPIWYVQKCLKENANNHCTTTYYLLCMDQNF